MTSEDYGGSGLLSDHWYNPPQSPRTVFIQSEQKGWKNHSGPSHPAHSSLNRYRLVNATELWAPERPDTETVSFPKQSTSWTLDIKRGTHNTIIQLFIHHSNIFFISNLHMSDLTHNCLYYILCFCYFVHICILFFYYLCLVLSLSFCCTVELMSL